MSECCTCANLVEGIVIPYDFVVIIGCLLLSYCIPDVKDSTVYWFSYVKHSLALFVCNIGFLENMVILIHAIRTHSHVFSKYWFYCMCFTDH